MSKPIQGKLILEYVCPACRTAIATEHDHAAELDMLSPTGHWASVKKIKWEGQCPNCYEWCEVFI